MPRKQLDSLAQDYDRLNYEHGELVEDKKKHDEIMREMSGLMDAQHDGTVSTHKTLQELFREREQLQEKVEDLQGQVGLMESRIFNKDEELAFRAQAMNNLQTAAARVQHNRFTIYVSRTGHAWHASADCQYLRQSRGVRTLEACTACTGG